MRMHYLILSLLFCLPQHSLFPSSRDIQKSMHTLKRSKKQKKTLFVLKSPSSSPSIKYIQSIKEPPKNFPQQLQKIPFADKEGIILEIKKISIKGVPGAYNAAILPYKEHYLLFAREDVPRAPDTILYPDWNDRLFVTELDASFQEITPASLVDTGSIYSEDARAFEMNGKIYLVYSQCEPITFPHPWLGHGRFFMVAEFDPVKRVVVNPRPITSPKLLLNSIEKNWTPFVVKNEGGFDKLFFLYTINPLVVCSFEENGSIEPQCIHPSSQEIKWSSNTWGRPCGGTPGILIDGEYLAFFHSHFNDGEQKWYSMGAYCFESTFPYRLTRFSSRPLLFSGIYSTKSTHLLWANIIHCVFPVGIAKGKWKDRRDVIYVVFGENDSAIKVATFDKEKLLKSLSIMRGVGDEWVKHPLYNH